MIRDIGSYLARSFVAWRGRALDQDIALVGYKYQGPPRRGSLSRSALTCFSCHELELPSFIFLTFHSVTPAEPEQHPPPRTAGLPRSAEGTHHGNIRWDIGRWLQEYALIYTSPPSPLLPLAHHTSQGSMCCRDDDAHEDRRGPPPNHGGGQRLGGGGGGGGGGQQAFQGSGNTLGGGGK